MTVMDELDARIVLSMAENSLNMNAVGRELYMHPNSIQYRVGKIKKATGLNPQRFYDLIELLPKAKEVLNGT